MADLGVRPAGRIRIRQELFVERAGGATWIAWTLLAGGDATLQVRPFLSGRESVDASLWCVVTVGEFLELERERTVCTDGERAALMAAIEAIVSGYAAGTRFGIRMDDDGLLIAAVPGQPLTWMDARVGDREITPRIGKPVEIQVLWYNALAVAGREDPRWLALMPQVREAVLTRDSGTAPQAPSPMSSMSITFAAHATTPCVPIKSSRWAGCRWRSSRADKRGESSQRLKPSC